MPRTPREDVAGAVHHVYARGNNQELIFRDDVDRERYLMLLEQVAGQMGWRVLAYCLMDNHAHVQLETPVANLAKGMQRLQGRYAQWFNRRHGRSGHLFQGRYGSKRIVDEPHFHAVVAYIARNPVDAGMCDNAEDWPWSSHAATVRRRRPKFLDHRRLLWYLRGSPEPPRRVYAGLAAGELDLDEIDAALVKTLLPRLRRATTPRVPSTG